MRTRPATMTGMILVVASGVLISPAWAAAALPVGMVTVLLARWQVRVMEFVGLGCAVVVAAAVVWIERRDAPVPNAGWTVSFEHLNGLAIFAVLAIAVGSYLERDT